MARRTVDAGGLAQWRAAPFLLIAFITIAIYVTPGSPPVIAVTSFGFGYALGMAIRLPGRLRLGVGALYLVMVTAIGVMAGRALSWCFYSAAALTLLLLLLCALADRIDLRTLIAPADAFKLIVLAGVSALFVPTVTVLLAWATDSTDALSSALPQAALTAATAILLTTAMVLAYEPHAYLVRGWRRQLELFTLSAVMLFLLLGVSLMDSDSVGGTGPLFLLVMTLGWLGLRFGPALATVGLVAAGCWIAFGVVVNTGAFVTSKDSHSDAVLSAQIYLIVLSIGIIFLSVYARYTRDQDATSRSTAELLSSAADGAAAQVFIKHFQAQTQRFVYVEVNDNFAADLGMSAAQVVGHSDEDLHTPKAAREFFEQDHLVMASGARHRFLTSATVNGRRLTYFASKFPVRDGHGAVIGVGGVSFDRTEELRRAALLQQVFARSPVPTARVGHIDTGMGPIQEVNDAFAALVGLPADRIVGRSLAAVLPSSEPMRLPDRLAQRREVRVRRPNGSELSVVATSTIVGRDEDSEQFVLLILEDVTAVRAAQAGLLHRATHDPLTDLLNRQALVERLAARAPGGSVPAGTVVWCCDIDGFKQFNDSLGHDTGDRVLLAIAHRVRASVASHDLVSRLGADEFVIVSTEPLSQAQALAVGERIRRAVAEPLDMDGRTHNLRVSVGLAISTGDIGAEELLRQADVALTRAKDAGRDRIEVYLPELDRRVQLRVAMRETLRAALAENRVFVEVQPVVELDSGVIVGAEALVRVRDVDDTVLPPAAFIPVAEESGLIVALGLRVLDLSLALCAQWAQRGSAVEIAVNASPKQLQDPDFDATVMTLLHAHGVPPQQLVIEVTESTVVDASGPTLTMLQRLRSAGVHVAIDDFGTGYSSLASLRDLPADIVKIDRSFVSGLGQDNGDEAIVRAVLAMAHATDRVVVAEGVETAAQAAQLVHFTCDRVQGFWFSPPVSPADFDPTAHWRDWQVRHPS